MAIRAQENAEWALGLEEARPRPVQLMVGGPGTTSLPGIATTGGGAGLLISFVTGDVEPTYVWPCVALAALGMAYDLARRALDQHHHP
ncbi:hypothetical protein [Streptomyces canus]|uniref:hypothetical protein n=1 Tax=Streptomyces canus TaxID=58343 RepID=UPI003252F2A4